MARLKIDIQNGIFEADGDEQFIKELYRDYNSEKSAKTVSKLFKKNENDSLVKESYSIAKDINLSMDRTTLKQFYLAKNPQSALERNVVFVYFLQQISKITKIATGHIYTCYKDLNIKPPIKLRQSLADTASKKGWLYTGSMNDIKITLKGEGFVEHELPKE
jgi:hypothetical protein